MNCYIISGGISGAITDPYSFEAQTHAQMYYEEIRHRTDDIEKIAKNTGFTPDQVRLVKKYLFFDEHLLLGKIKRFDENFHIAESWQRLADMPEYIQQHDKLLIPHELKEMSLICNGFSQDEAHKLASEEFNYMKESADFYEGLEIEGKIYKTNEVKELEKNISRNDYDDLEL